MAVVNSSKFNFSDIVQKYLYDYRDGVQEAAFEAIDEVSKEAVKKLKRESPKRTGEYAKGWTRKVEKGRLHVATTIYGKKPATYAVAHLLEKGHKGFALRGGGRSKDVEPKPHIADVERWAMTEAEDRILSKLEKGVL